MRKTHTFFLAKPRFIFQTKVKLQCYALHLDYKFSFSKLKTHESKVEMAFVNKCTLRVIVWRLFLPCHVWSLNFSDNFWGNWQKNWFKPETEVKLSLTKSLVHPVEVVIEKTITKFRSYPHLSLLFITHLYLNENKLKLHNFASHEVLSLPHFSNPSFRVRKSNFKFIIFDFCDRRLN